MKHLPPSHAAAGSFGDTQIGVLPHAAAQDLDLGYHKYCVEDHAYVNIPLEKLGKDH